MNGVEPSGKQQCDAVQVLAQMVLATDEDDESIRARLVCLGIVPYRDPEDLQRCIELFSSVPS